MSASLASFRPFNESDYYAFAGVESNQPLIDDHSVEGRIVILDGNIVDVFNNVDFDGGLDQIGEYTREFPTRQLAEDFAVMALVIKTSDALKIVFDHIC